jgi:uncharacterized protein
VVATDCELVTVLVGEGATPAVDDVLRAWLADHRPAVVVEWLVGGQPLYPYVFGAE